MTQLSLSSLNDTVELQGTLERVVFHNEENGYTVFRVRPEGKDEVDLVTVVGHMGSPQAGASLRIKGRWVNNARFGRQVQMDSFESLLPATAEGIKLYLASGLIKGIGKSIAARIVKAFGEDTLRIFDEEPQRLLEISGITQKKLVTIVECWTEHQGVRNLVQFLQPHDIGGDARVGDVLVQPLHLPDGQRPVPDHPVQLRVSGGDLLLHRLLLLLRAGRRHLRHRFQKPHGQTGHTVFSSPDRLRWCKPLLPL